MVANREFFIPYLHSAPPLGRFPSEYRHPVWRGKTRMAWLPDGEKISNISLFVLTQLTNVTDGQTDRHTDTAWRHRPRLCIASRGKNRTVFDKVMFKNKKRSSFWLAVYLRTQTLNTQFWYGIFIILHGSTDFFCFFVFYFVLFVFFNHCISVFMLLCFVFCALLVILSLLSVIMGGQHDGLGLLLYGSPPIILHLYLHV